MPFKLKLVFSETVAFLIYLPLARISLVLEKIGLNISNMPLMEYRNKPFYFLRTDSLDRFGTRIEKRFTKVEIEKMLIEAGFQNIKFSSSKPNWVVVAEKA